MDCSDSAKKLIKKKKKKKKLMCPEDDMERNVGESKLFKGVQVICSITALKLKV